MRIHSFAALVLPQRRVRRAAGRHAAESGFFKIRGKVAHNSLSHASEEFCSSLVIICLEMGREKPLYHVDRLSSCCSLHMDEISHCASVQLYGDWKRGTRWLNQKRQEAKLCRTGLYGSHTCSILTLNSERILLFAGDGTDSTHRITLLFNQNDVREKSALSDAFPMSLSQLFPNGNVLMITKPTYDKLEWCSTSQGRSQRRTWRWRHRWGVKATWLMGEQQQRKL